MTPQEKAKDRRLRKNYRWTLEMYNALDRLQHHICPGCGKEFKSPPNVDHRHFKVITKREPGFGINGFENGWEASVSEFEVFRWAKTKREAIKLAKDLALPLSVRGLLCAGRHCKAGQGCCNRLLGRVDNVIWLKSMIRYLEDPPARKILQEAK